MHKRLNLRFEYILIFLLTLILILTAVTGVMVFSRTNTTIDKARISIRPKENLILIKSINSELHEAENLIHAYNLTLNPNHLKSYDLLIRKTAVKLLRLRTYSHRNPAFNDHVDSLTDLVADKYLILDSMINLQNSYRVNHVLKKVVQRAEIVPEKSSENQAEEKKFFEKLFGKRKKKHSELNHLKQNSNQLQALKKDLRNLKQQEGTKEITNNNIELNLMQLDQKITVSINRILGQLELDERREMVNDAHQARLAASEVRWIVGLFSIFLGLLLVLFGIMINRYILKNKQYSAFLIESSKQNEALARSKMRFVSIMSHEIRTPLHAISGFGEQLSKSPVFRNADREKEYLSNLREASDHLLNIVNDVLDYTKLEFNKMDLDHGLFNPATESMSVHRMFSKSAEKKGLALNLDLPENAPDLYGDAMKFRQILVNLVSNAIKFTDKGEVKIQIVLGELNAGTHQLELNVSDTGVGIEQSELPKIFNEFEQEDVTISRQYGGSGLGLTITRMLVALQQGTIHVESQKGVGSIFTVNLKYDAWNDSLHSEKIKSPLEGSHLVPGGKKILVVDDEIYNIKLVRSMLEGTDCQLLEADNGQQALTLAENHLLDVALIDIRMPGMNGIETANRMRETYRTKKHNCLMIALSAGMDEEMKKEATKIFDAYLDKPFREEELFELLNFETTNKKINDPESDSDKSINLNQLKKLTSNNQDFYRDMLQTFITSTSTGLAEMELDFASKKFSHIREIAHRLASPCKHLEANALYKILKTIETKEGFSEQQIGELIKQALFEYKKVERQITDEISGLD